MTALAILVTVATFPFIPWLKGWRRLHKRALLCSLGLERLGLAEVRSGFENSADPRAQMAAEIDRLRGLVDLQAEEIRIKDARLGAIRKPERPHYPPAERLAILLLRARAGWNAAETAQRFLVSRATIATWTRRVDEGGPDALVQTPVPVNRYDDQVALVVRHLHQAAPQLGRRKKAELLARVGLHLAASTVRRLLERKPKPRPPLEPRTKVKVAVGNETKRAVTARFADHLWHVDITAIAIGSARSGFWLPWWPFCLLMRWALSWHIALVVDHFSRALIAFAVFRKEPTALEICALLDRAVMKAGRAPRHIVSDQGAQFQRDYRDWCSRNGVKPRFGAIGKKRSIAVIERLILSLKSEFLWKILVPASQSRMQALISAYALWYNEFRTHCALGGRTPADLRDGVAPARLRMRLEPRARIPFARGHPTVRRCNRLELVVSYLDGHALLPIVELREAA